MIVGLRGLACNTKFGMVDSRFVFWSRRPRPLTLARWFVW